MWEQEYKIEQEKKRSIKRIHYLDIMEEIENNRFKNKKKIKHIDDKSNTLLVSNTIIESEEDGDKFDNNAQCEDFESAPVDLYQITDYNNEEDGIIENSNTELLQFPNNYWIWNSSAVTIDYRNDNFQSMNKKYKSFDIGKDIKYLLERIINFKKPNDSYESIHDYSKLTIGDFMTLHRKMILDNNMTEIEGQDIMNLIKKTLPPGCKLLNKESKDAQLYTCPPNVLKYDLCHKGCNVYVGSESEAFECSTCKSVRFKHCTKKICHEKQNYISCHHIRPAIKQVGENLTYLFTNK
jgi:hypothetical protein